MRFIVYTLIYISGCNSNFRVETNGRTPSTPSHNDPIPESEKMDKVDHYLKLSFGEKSQVANGLDRPNHLWCNDESLIVTDYGNNRAVLFKDLQNISGEHPKIAIGQPSLSHNSYGVSGSITGGPAGIYSDGSSLYIADWYNHRVLVWNQIPDESGQEASNILGQIDFESAVRNSLGVSDRSLYHPWGIHSDGERLFIADSDNNRVLIWNSLPTSSREPPDIVIGQQDFSSSDPNLGGVSASTLNYPTKAFSDGTRLFIADSGNHRVLVWNSIPTSSGEGADFVLGQPDLSSSTYNNGGVSGSTLDTPYDLYISEEMLFVADYYNHRILVWESLPTATGQAADIVLGQQDLVSNVSNSSGITGSTLSYPTGVCATGSKLYIADEGNHRVLAWNDYFTLTNGAPADYVLGQVAFDTGTANNGIVSGISLNSPESSLAIDDRFFVADSKNNRVLVWNEIPENLDSSADFALGQGSLSATEPNRNASVSHLSLANPTKVFSDGKKLYVVDTNNHRVLVWNSIPSSSDDPPDFALGQPNLESNDANNGGVSGQTLFYPNGLYSNGNQLFISDAGNNRVLVWEKHPTTSGKSADYAIGQATLYENSWDFDIVSATSLSFPSGIYYDGTRFFVVDKLNNRVLVWKGIPKPGEAAIEAIGQPDLISNGSDRLTGSSLSLPTDVYSDGNTIYIADTGNSRVVGFQVSPEGRLDASSILGKSDVYSATVGEMSYLDISLSEPTSVTASKSQLIITDKLNHKLYILGRSFERP